MDKILTLAFTLLTITLSAQFKTINNGPKKANTNEATKYNAPFIRPESVTSDRLINAAFRINPINQTALKSLNSDSSIELFKDQSGKIRSISAKVDFNSRAADNTKSRVDAFVDFISNETGIKTTNTNFEIISENTDELGMSHVKLQQQYNGVDIFGGETILHGLNRNYDFLHGSLFTDLSLDTNPSLNEATSESHAVSSVGKLYNGSNDPLNIIPVAPMKSNLVIYTIGETNYLAYHHSFYSDMINRWEVFVDAQTGEILDKYQSICKFHNHDASHVCSNHEEEVVTISKTPISNEVNNLDGPKTANAIDLLGVNRTINVYNVGSKDYMIDASREMFINNSSMPNDPKGAIWTIDAFNTSPQNNSFNYDHVTTINNSWNDRASVSAQHNGSKAYLYFRNLHTRNSINGSGGNIVGMINVSDEDGKSMGNAFWNGAAMFYGNGDSAFKPLAAGLDVAGHEMTHGVIQNTANLTYQGESGALNESFADVFGVMIDRDDWLIGEDVVKTGAFPSGALRSMSDPHNGAATGDFGSGWQPKKYSERYTGSQDNGGVHINSGIPNHAFYLFTNDTRLGSTDNDRKVKAEKVYYRALTQYLTKSSQFVDARIAVVRAAQDLYGSTVADAARLAFDKVEVFGESGGTYTNDTGTNPGADLIVCTDANNNDIFLFDGEGNSLASPSLSPSNPISKPSVTDRGDIIVFVADDLKIHFIIIDWASGMASEGTFTKSGNNSWRNAVISKDGNLLAALKDDVDNTVVIYDITNSTGNLNIDPDSTFTLKNPTYTTGISTGDVLYADAMEFDYSGEYLMYDAENSIKSNTAGSIEFWDIGFIKVWNKASKTFSIPDQIEKLFQGLPEGVSIGNPAFSKNSNYIIAFDFIEDSDVSILGANIETGGVNLIYENSGLGYPSYSRTDEQVLFENPNNGTYDLGIAAMKSNKIEAESTPFLFLEGYRFATWFSNGERVLSSINDVNISDVKASLSPNPSSAIMNMSLEVKKSQITEYTIVNLDGKVVQQKSINLNQGINSIPLNIVDLQSGMYVIKTNVDEKSLSMKLIKI